MRLFSIGRAPFDDYIEDLVRLDDVNFVVGEVIFDDFWEDVYSVCCGLSISQQRIQVCPPIRSGLTEDLLTEAATEAGDGYRSQLGAKHLYSVQAS